MISEMKDPNVSRYLNEVLATSEGGKMLRKWGASNELIDYYKMERDAGHNSYRGLIRGLPNHLKDKIQRIEDKWMNFSFRGIHNFGKRFYGI